MHIIITIMIAGTNKKMVLLLTHFKRNGCNFLCDRIYENFVFYPSGYVQKISVSAFFSFQIKLN
jgi:hypothetical protein